MSRPVYCSLYLINNESRLRKIVSESIDSVQLWSFAPRIFTQEPFPDSPANEDGEARARKTLLNLYVAQAKAAARAKRMQDPV